MKYIITGFLIAIIAFGMGVATGHKKMFDQCQIELRKERESSFDHGVTCGTVAVLQSYNEGKQFDVKTITSRAYEIGKEHYYIGR